MKEAKEEHFKWTKVINRFDPELIAGMRSMKDAELKARVLSSQANLMESERKRKNDEDLHDAAEAHADLKKPYDEVKKFQTAIVQFGLLLLEERGVSLNT